MQANPSNLDFGIQTVPTILSTLITPITESRTPLSVSGSPTWDALKQAILTPAPSAYIIYPRVPQVGDVFTAKVECINDTQGFTLVWKKNDDTYSIALATSISNQNISTFGITGSPVSAFTYTDLEAFWWSLEITATNTITISFGATEETLSPDVNLTNITSTSNLSILESIYMSGADDGYIYVSKLNNISAIFELGYDGTNFVNLVENPPYVSTVIDSIVFPTSYSGEWNPLITPNRIELVSNNGVTWDPVDEAWVFNGSSWLEYIDKDEYTMGSLGFSMEVLIKWNSISLGQRQGIVGHYNNSVNRLQFYRGPEATDNDSINFLNKSTDTFAKSNIVLGVLSSTVYKKYEVDRTSSNLIVEFDDVNVTNETTSPPRNEGATFENIDGLLEIGRYTSDGLTYYYLEGKVKSLKIYRDEVLVFDLGRSSSGDPINLVETPKVRITEPSVFDVEYDALVDSTGNIAITNTPEGEASDVLNIPVTGARLLTDKNISLYPDIVKCGDSLIDTPSTEVNVPVVNSANVDVTITDINNILEQFKVSHSNLPVVVKPLSLTFEDSTVITAVQVQDMIEINGYLFIALGDTGVGHILSYEILEDGTLSSLVDSIAYDEPVYSLNNYDNILFSARDTYGVTSYIVNTDGTFNEVNTLSFIGGNAKHVFVTNDYVFASYEFIGLVVYLYNSDTAEFIEITFDYNNGTATSCFVDDNFVYLGNGANGITVYSFDGAILTQESTYTLPGTVVSVTSTDNSDLLLVSHLSEGITCLSIDINTKQLAFVSNVNFGTATKIIFDGEYIYSGSSSGSGLNVVGLQDDGTLTFLLNKTETSETTNRPVVYNGYIYSAEGDTGVKRYSKNVDYKLDVSVTFTSKADGLIQDTLQVISDSTENPESTTLQGTGISNSENGTGSYSYYTHAVNRMVQQYKES